MADGFLGGWLQGEQSRLQQEQARRQAEAHQLQQMGGMLSLQQTMEEAPLRRQLLEAQARQAGNPAPKWKEIERFNERTGQKEKVLVDMNNPSHIIPMGGQEAESINHVNLGNQMLPVGSRSGQPRGMPMPISVSPNTQATLGQAQQHWGGLSADQASRLGIDSANLGLRADQHQYETGRTPVTVPTAPRGPQVPMMGPQELNRMAPQSAVTNPAMASDEARIRTAETQPNGGGMLPSASVLPQGPVMASVPPKAQAAMRADQPQSRTSATSALQNMDRMESMAAELLSHPGLTDITGRINQYETLDVFPNTRDARGLSNALTRQVSIQVLQSMRDASKTGGAVGQVTEKEWPRLEQGIAALDNAQSTGAYKTALVNLRNQLAESKNRVRAAYESTYGPLQYEAPKYQRQNQELPPSAGVGPEGLSGVNLQLLKRADEIIGR